MNRNDYKQLASSYSACFRSGGMTTAGLAYLVSQLEASNGNFNRAAFYKAMGLDDPRFST